MGTFIRHLFLLFFGLFIFSTLHGDTSWAQKNPGALFQEAEDLFKKKRYAAALELYEKIITVDPSFTRGYRGITRCYDALGDPQGAVIFMETLFLENPEKGEVSYGLGYSLYHLKKYDDSLNYFQKAIELNQDLAVAWNNSAVIYHFIKHDDEKARHYYKKAIEISKRTGDDWTLKIAEENLAHLPKPVELKPVKEKLTLEEFMNRFLSYAEKEEQKKIRELILGQKENSEQAMDWFLGKAMRSFAEGRTADENTTIMLAKLLEKEYNRSFESPSLKDRLDHYKNLSGDEKMKIVEGENLLEEGFIREQNNNYEEAQSRYSKAFLCFEGINDKSREGLALLYLGDIYRKMKKYSLARESYIDGLTRFIETGEKEREASLLSSLGITCYLLGEYPVAQDFLEQSLEIYRLLKDEEAEKKVKNNLELIKAKIQ